jgi:hypothetical protein
MAIHRVQLTTGTPFVRPYRYSSPAGAPKTVLRDQ